MGTKPLNDQMSGTKYIFYYPDHFRLNFSREQINFKTNSKHVQQQQNNNTSNTFDEDLSTTQDNTITDNADNEYPPTSQPPAYYSNKWHSPEAIHHFLGRSRANTILPLDQPALYISRRTLKQLSSV